MFKRQLLKGAKLRPRASDPDFDRLMEDDEQMNASLEAAAPIEDEPSLNDVHTAESLQQFFAQQDEPTKAALASFLTTGTALPVLAWPVTGTTINSTMLAVLQTSSNQGVLGSASEALHLILSSTSSQCVQSMPLDWDKWLDMLSTAKKASVPMDWANDDAAMAVVVKLDVDGNYMRGARDKLLINVLSALGNQPYMCHSQGVGAPVVQKPYLPEVIMGMLKDHCQGCPNHGLLFDKLREAFEKVVLAGHKLESIKGIKLVIYLRKQQHFQGYLGYVFCVVFTQAIFKGRLNICTSRYSHL